MPTERQMNNFEQNLKSFMRDKLQEKYLTLNEASTRIIVNQFLSEVLGYEELEDIRTEYRIKSDYADYVIQLNKKLRIVIEVKAMGIDISGRHLKQAFTYAVNEGIDWIVLTNARQIAVYRVIFGKPPQQKLLFEYALFPLTISVKELSKSLFYLSKVSFKKNEIEKLWTSYQVLSCKGLYKYVFEPDIISSLKRKIKKDAGINFTDQDIREALLCLVNIQNSFKMPKIEHNKK